jgi:voltage-gated sodium channel
MRHLPSTDDREAQDNALIAAFLIFNILIGVVVNSLEDARAIEHARERADRLEHADPEAPVVEERIAEALDRLEADIRRGRV